MTPGCVEAMLVLESQVTGRVNVDNRDCVVEKSKAPVQFQASTVSTIFHLSCHRYNVDLLI